MRKIACVMVAVLVGMSLMAALVPAESAPLPVWKAGDRWAVGSENTNQTDIGNDGNLSGVLSGLYGITNLSGEIGSSGGEWMTFEVTGENESEYTLHYSFALRSKSDMKASFSAMVAVPGEYTKNSFENAPKAPVPMKVDFSSSLYAVASGDMHIMRDSMEISDMSVNLDEKLSALFTSSNTPYVGDYGIFGYFMLENNDSSSGMMPSSFELSYRSTDIDLSQNLKLQANLEFSPPLEFIEFPLSTDSEWSDTTYEMVNGTYSGVIDIKGLPPMVESALKLGTGQDLPIQIEKIDTHEDGFNNGIIAHQGYENITMNCPDTVSVAGPHGGQITAYEIGFGPQSAYGPQIYLLYSPDTNFIAGIYEEGLGTQMPISPVGESGIAGQFGALASSMKIAPNTSTIGYMDYDHASKEISATESDMNGASAGSNFTILVLAVLVIAGIAAAVGAVLVRRRRAISESVPQYPVDGAENTAEREMPEEEQTPNEEEQTF